MAAGGNDFRPRRNLSGMPLDRVRAEVERDLDPEWVERYGDAVWAASLRGLGKPGPPELERKTDVLADRPSDDPIDRPDRS